MGIIDKNFIDFDNAHNILITGESGTGKELVAHQLHNMSKVQNDQVPWVILESVHGLVSV